MIKKLYWTFRLIGYIGSLGGALFTLKNQAAGCTELQNVGLGIVGIGFLSLFISYGLRAWLRFRPAPKDIPADS